MIIVVVAPPGETGCVAVLEAWSETSGTAAASYAMSEVSPTVYESPDITGLAGEWRIRMRNAGSEPVYTGYVSFGGNARGHAYDSPGGNNSAEILAKISGGEVAWTSPVTQQGKLNPIVIGDDYLAASGRAFDWFFDPGVFNIASAQCFFGFAGANVGRVAVSGTVSAVTISGNPKWRLRFELTNTATKTLKPGEIEYSVELRGPTPEHMTKRFGKGTVVQSFTVDAA